MLNSYVTFDPFMPTDPILSPRNLLPKTAIKTGDRESENPVKTEIYPKYFRWIRTVVLKTPMTLSWRSCRFEPLRAYRPNG